MLNLSLPDPSFSKEVLAEPGGESLLVCYSCGTCVSACPVQWVNERYNPRRLIKKAVLDMREEVLSDPVIWYCSACDLCYQKCPQQIHISDLMKAFCRLAQREGYKPSHIAAQVNERTCVACGLCAEVCPYEAIELVTKRVLGREKTVAQVNQFLCMECGICAASCRSGSIDVADFADQGLADRIKGWVEEDLLPVEAPYER